jgi:hypothetical protein
VSGRYYEDIVVGEVRESRSRTVSLDELIEFASRYDPQYFHADPEAAKHSAFGEVVASGIHSAALWRSLDHEINGVWSKCTHRPRAGSRHDFSTVLARTLAPIAARALKDTIQHDGEDHDGDPGLEPHGDIDRVQCSHHGLA